jgi:WD40 repeat protein
MNNLECGPEKGDCTPMARALVMLDTSSREVSLPHRNGRLQNVIMTADTVVLRTLSTHRLPNPIRFSSLCGPRDLLAVVHSTWDISVCRIISGQVAFAIKRRDDCEVRSVGWRPDGSMLAVSWNDGTYAIYDGERGGIISTGRSEADQTQQDVSL